PLPEVGLQYGEVADVYYQSVVKVSRPHPVHAKLGLDVAEVAGIDYVVGAGVAPLLGAELLGSLASTDYQVATIGGWRVGEVPAPLHTPVVHAIRQVSG